MEDTTLLPVTAYGWVRRASLDLRGYDCWEAPCGCLYQTTPKGIVPKFDNINPPNHT